jgi:hypothetical protein
VKLTGTQAAVPIFADFSRSLPRSSREFPVPSDIITAEIDPETGGLRPRNARRASKSSSRDAARFECPLHRYFRSLAIGVRSTEHDRTGGLGDWGKADAETRVNGGQIPLPRPQSPSHFRRIV